MNTELVKGFKDYTEEEAVKKAEIKKLLIEKFENYGFEPAETPIVEYEEFVKGDNEKDEAVSDIFKLRDRGNRALALRYEFTFQLKRIAKNKNFLTEDTKLEKFSEMNLFLHADSGNLLNAILMLLEVQ